MRATPLDIPVTIDLLKRELSVRPCVPGPDYFGLCGGALDIHDIALPKFGASNYAETPLTHIYYHTIPSIPPGTDISVAKSHFSLDRDLASASVLKNLN